MIATYFHSVSFSLLKCTFVHDMFPLSRFFCSCLTISIVSLSSCTQNSDIDLEDGNKKKKAVKLLRHFQMHKPKLAPSSSSLRPTQRCVSSSPCAVLLALQQPSVFVLRLVIDPFWSPARINAAQVNLNFRAARLVPPAILDCVSITSAG